MKNPTLDFFDAQAVMYDAYQRSCIPKYEEMLAVAADCLQDCLADADAPVILDLGCGTGAMTLALMDALPSARFVCLDGSHEMLSAARRKLPEDRCAFYHADLALSDCFSGLAPASFDAVVSIVVLEHLPFDAYKRVLASALSLLKPGGTLTTVEGYAGAVNQRLYFREMARWEANAVNAGSVTEEQLRDNAALSKEKENHYFAEMDEKKAWWREAGFVDVFFLWQYYCVAALVGRKPE